MHKTRNPLLDNCCQICIILPDNYGKISNLTEFIVEILDERFFISYLRKIACICVFFLPFFTIVCKTGQSPP